MDAVMPSPRPASVADAADLARLLHDFNTEFDTPTPGTVVLERRLRAVLAEPAALALLVEDPPVGFALVTLRPSVWYDGRVAVLDELYVRPERRNEGLGSALVGELLTIAAAEGIDLIEINVDEADTDAQRFYERHGFSGLEPDTGERAYYFSRDLTS